MPRRTIMRRGRRVMRRRAMVRRRRHVTRRHAVEIAARIELRRVMGCRFRLTADHRRPAVIPAAAGRLRVSPLGEAKRGECQKAK